MNQPLIDQLKLAIQVEQGEIPREEIQYRFVGSTAEWFMAGCPGWMFARYEYRRKPKPLECWVNYPASSTHSVDSYTSKGEAELSARNYGCSMLRTAVHMREVAND